MMDVREAVEQIEDAMQGMPPAFLPIKHYFANGMYAREMTMPAGAIVTGAIHKTTHFCILSQGRVRVMSEDGIDEFVAPAIIISQPGTKRAIHALEDTVWTNIHATNETDLDKLVEELTESTVDQLQGGDNNKQELAYADQLKLEH
jgi:hypothetical protein